MNSSAPDWATASRQISWNKAFALVNQSSDISVNRFYFKEVLVA
jgi:hypothetical protein